MAPHPHEGASRFGANRGPNRGGDASTPDLCPRGIGAVEQRCEQRCLSASAVEPEDCGGVWGYEALLAILGDASHPENAERAEWASAWGGAALDPDAFDPDEFSDNLRSLHLARFDD